ncbi:Hpt domain-containing protein [Enterovirga rhinocerotis]|uniref:HPt (Histidine-containing phosphotransfer) domain-containing protein n=1 Tax=Enterovirga rhinocerotis TaxID=1339210 RepID=A0A4R7C8S8_9HYPH|nr:Hpt domain-containing protein [Enterovirga rhinocerotis]TDR94791.1 HPt (histidine-containing phosphotransfer) domain-containing protein [Enterovirga rhinocerotis]
MTSDTDLVDFGFLRQQTFGDEVLERDLLRLFLGQCKTLLPVLVQEDDLIARRDAAHSLRGAASSLGAQRISEVALLVELAAMAGEARSGADLRRAIEATERVISLHLAARAA